MWIKTVISLVLLWWRILGGRKGERLERRGKEGIERREIKRGEKTDTQCDSVWSGVSWGTRDQNVSKYSSCWGPRASTGRRASTGAAATSRYWHSLRFPKAVGGMLSFL